MEIMKVKLKNKSLFLMILSFVIAGVAGVGVYMLIAAGKLKAMLNAVQLEEAMVYSQEAGIVGYKQLLKLDTTDDETILAGMRKLLRNVNISGSCLILVGVILTLQLFI